MTGPDGRSFSSSCPSISHLSPSSDPDTDMLSGVLNMSPNLSSLSNSIAKLESTASLEASRNWDSENTVGCSSIISVPSDHTPTPKSSAVMRKEIATLEAEILHLERYLLSLYRTAFNEQLPGFSNMPKNHLQYKTGSPLQAQSPHNLKVHQQTGDFIHHDQSSPAPHGWSGSSSQSCIASLQSTSTMDQKKVDSGRRSLADHLGASCLVNDHDTPDRLSEDIVRCISSIYCRLCNPLHSQLGSAASPTSSLSSSSIFSSRNPYDNWSPRCNGDAMFQHQLQGLKGESGPYDTMLEVLKICLDDGSFNYAATMLKKFRSLVQRLEKLDPRKLKREEKLAFWINIHNALVMHAYLAYGTHNRVKSASILKAAYNVGGQGINACIIQSSILGIRSHYSEPWLQALFSPGRKSKTGNIRHVYALEYPEPLVHFALCSGAYSDPAVRVYTSKNIFQELKVAKEEFIQSKVYVHKESKIFLPKILWYFGKDMSVDTEGVMEVISECLTQGQVKAMRKCMRGKANKCIHWLSQSSSFRYVIHGELAKARTMVWSDLLIKEHIVPIHFVLLVSRQGKVRLAKWYSPYTLRERSKVIRELSGIIPNRGPKLCNFVEWRGFRAVCELDLIFNFHKAYYILDEILIAGEVQESSKRSVIRLVRAHGEEHEEDLEKQRAAVVELRELEKSVEANPDDPFLRFNLAVCLWEKCECKEKAAEHLVVAVKLNPQNATAFKYLGHYYYEKEKARALKCYQRAVSLNPDDFQSGDALCDMLDQSGKETLELSLCTEASQKSPRAFWAFRRLGYIHLHYNRCSEAVSTLQHAIRGFPTSPDLWEALGLAYQKLGMFTAATKSYGRAIELEDRRVFALIQSGNIFLTLGNFQKGVEQFQRALEISPQNVSANYGLASGLLAWSKECINMGAFRWGASLLELNYAKCFPWIEDDENVEFDVETFHASILTWKQTCYLAATSAKKSYQRALHLAPWQANLYIDIGIASDLISSMNENYGQDQHPWQLSEKMVLGALLLEGDNYEFWVALGCLSGYNALRQHALIRGLQLDVSLAVAWAYLGKLYREEGEKSLARLAFDCSRSIDPSLSLPWAGMSADSQIRDMTPEEAFESCSRAAQILPVAEFQVGLAKLALISGSLMSSQVFGAIRQAVQKAPHYPETHNLHGLVCEARSEYQAAITSFRLARCAIISSGDTSKSCLQDIAVNLARSLSKAGYAADAVQECESLRKEGMLDSEGLQIYAFCLWQLGENDHALSVVRNLASSVSAMERAFAAASVSFICRMLYYISGLDLAVSSILKMPKEFLQSTKVWIVASAIHALDHSNRLALAVSSSQYSLLSHDEIIEKHYLTALANLVKHGSDYCLGFQSGISHVKNALHSYPNSNLLRNLLGHLLLSCEEWKETHVASRCCITEAPNCASKQGLKSGCEILGAGAVACYAIGNVDPKFSYPACGYQCLNGPGAVQELQKYMHQEPWNHRAQYLLILNLLQKAREERFPSNICVILERLILVALSNEFYSRESVSYQYQKFQLLLCASEISLQGGNIAGCIKHAKNASSLLIPNNYLFFGHLLLCRAYAAVDDYTNLQQQYIRCLELETDYHIGWVCLKIIESLYNVESDSKISVLSFKKCSKEWKKSLNMWTAVFNLVVGLIYLWKEEYFSAEESIAQACSLASSESCLFLCHGVACVKLARQFCSSDYLSLAVNSLTSAHANSVIPLPIVSLLLAQAEGSLGLKQNWEKNLRLEWYSWPPEMRPAELFFQMHLLSIQSESGFKTPSRVEFCQSSLKWVLRAIHTNPSSLRYWNILHKLME
uniref:DUF547 domain-containing protein n=1 Tax=Salix viminalis TaxID=40686 RepID=A0A6N2K3A7_SALVM